MAFPPPRTRLGFGKTGVNARRRHSEQPWASSVSNTYTSQRGYPSGLMAGDSDLRGNAAWEDPRTLPALDTLAFVIGPRMRRNDTVWEKEPGQESLSSDLPTLAPRAAMTVLQTCGATPHPPVRVAPASVAAVDSSFAQRRLPQQGQSWLLEDGATGHSPLGQGSSRSASACAPPSGGNSDLALQPWRAERLWWTL